ncbi:MAG: carboxypeptidase-like regulatory domain-containing protein [Bacteroidales bacterium]
MTTRLLFILIVISSNLALSQDPVLQTRIDLELKDASLEQVLKDITAQTGIHFSYDSRLIDKNKKTSLNYKGENLKNVLEHICGVYDLEFSLVRNQIVLRKAITYVDPDIRYTISGHIRDKASGETLPGATVIVKELNTGTTSNAYGFYSISLPPGQYSLLFSFVGFKQQPFDIYLEKNLRKNAELESDSRILGEVTIIADENAESLQKSQSSLISVNPRSFEQLPEFAGENGLIKSLQTLPGIQTHSDGSSFFFVRGGNKDQNLILIDEAPVYNPAHLFGFYSVIIPDVAKEINIYKADIPVDKAGRLSSLIDVHTRDGNMKKFNLEGVLNPLMYRFSIESPLVKEKSSFFTSFRRSNFEWLYRQRVPNGDFHIQDFNAKLNWRINDKNRIFFSVFRGNDNYTAPGDQGKVGVAWRNFTSTARWNHIFSDRLFSNATIYASEYNYTLFTGAFPWESGIKDLGLKYDFSWFINPDLTWRFGFSHINHEFNPGNFSGYNEDISAFVPKVYADKASETSVYFSREKRINDRWAWKAGIRLPLWLNRGPAVVFAFDENQNVGDTLIFQPNEPIAAYLNADIRLSARYKTGDNSSLRFSLGNYHQNLHLLSNSISPFSSFELWMPSGRNIKPQRALQFTAGLNKLFPEQALEIGMEVYNKIMYNQIEYVNHAKLLLNPLIEGELYFGESNSYGVEFYMKRTKGRLTGWASYTLSRVFNHFEDLNNNQKYPAFYDRPHDVSVFLSWQASPKVNLSLNWVYFTGSAITTPVGYYQYNGSTVPIYGEKNNDRLPDYHRLDFSFSWNLSKPQNSFQHSLNFGLYNLYNRINPVSINFNKIQNDDGNFVVPANYFESHDILSTQKYLGGFMPSVTYKFKIR